MVREKKIGNAMKRSEVHRKNKREKEQEKLKRRMEIRKAEKEKGVGEERKKERLAKNIPNTLDNTRIYDSSSYLTADPKSLQAAAERAAEASRRVNEEVQAMIEEDSQDESDDDAEDDSEDEGDEAENGEDEAMPEAGPSTTRQAEEEEAAVEEPSVPPAPVGPPRIMITTSPSPCKETYAFCEDLKNIFPGGEFFKRPKGRGFELGRIARWAAKRQYNSLMVVNEDHKTPNAITLINLPAGPTAYFKLTSIQLGREIYGHAKATSHTPELILNGFSTLLGNSVGRMFGSLFPPQPQFRGRQVVTLHNQRDFLFFRRHRYAFASATSAKLQEIGPRFTLKMRWLRKGLPAVTASDGSVPRGGDAEDDDEEIARQEKMDEDEAMEEMGKGMGAPAKKKNGGDPDLGIPPLDEEQEYEWKWKPKMEVSRRTFFL
ncbi:putative nucleolar protein [Papiliotrema laurentii]|uniref:Nucleolar protein n=1 Tax=Papiliotrema laurentii TaxID=5418 RepID=A0AAD9CZ29_PAPLA|nr:putative nucleolar protein [Papiliotrema laurentii]